MIIAINKKKVEWSNYLYLIVPIIVVIIIMIIPFFRTIYYSFTKFDGFHPPSFIGLKNYISLGGNPHFLSAIKNNFIISLALPIWVGLPLVLAVLLFQNPGKFLKTARMTIMLPVALSMSVTGIIFNSFFTYYGPINTVLVNMGLKFAPVDWLGNSRIAMILIIVTAIWKDFGVTTVIFLAGLSNLNKELIEAARIDGANKLQEFFHIIIPQLNPIIVFIVAITLVSDYKNMFDYVYNLTQGGPGFATQTIEFLLYNEAFRFLNMGFASALGVLMFVIIVIITYFQIKIMTRSDT
jgi:multiple sugar transport system permease protein